MKYTIQCKDANSGAVGCFGFVSRRRIGGVLYFVACTPVFGSLYGFYQWSKSNGVELDHAMSQERCDATPIEGELC